MCVYYTSASDVVALKDMFQNNNKNKDTASYLSFKNKATVLH